MRRSSLCFAVLLASAAVLGAQAPSTDIYLAPLTVSGGRVTVGTPINVTHRPGYDNQPSFTPDSRSVLFTSVHEDAQSDIYRYDIASQSIARVTSTPESEYSATVMPGGKRFSVIRVERDSTQRLWSFALDGTDPRIVIESLKPVGYHAWLDANTLVMFVLGRPNALVRADLRTGKLDTLARNIGRSLAPLPDRSGFSYVRLHDSTATLVAMHTQGGTTDLVSMPRGTEDIAWLSNGTVLAASGSALLSWHDGQKGWTPIADLAGAGLTRMSRVAVSPDGKWIAIVSAER